MRCPSCEHEFPLTWRRYFKSGFGLQICPSCGSKFVLAFTRRSVLFYVSVMILLWGFPFSLSLLGLEMRWAGVAGAILIGVFLVVDRHADERLAKPTLAVDRAKKSNMRATVLVLLFALAAAGVFGAVLLAKSEPQMPSISDPDTRWLHLSDDEKTPESFEPYLEAHPGDPDRRIAAVVWYGRCQEDLDKLKYHTRQLIRQHPSSMHIYFENSTAFYLDPEYRQEVIALLEEQLQQGRSDRGLFWNLAQVCKHGAVPPVGDDPEDVASFLQYYGLPEGTPLPSEVDPALAAKAVQYFRLAIAAAERDQPEEASFYVSFYSEQLTSLLLELGRPEDAITTCEKALPYATEDSKSDLLVTYGRCLMATSQPAKAKEALEQVRACDKESWEQGPGHATADAETLMGLMALDEGDVDEAVKRLFASCDVQKCCHNTTKGMPLTLARKLVAAGEYEAVTKFCQKVLSDFTPDDKDVGALLDATAERQVTTNEAP